MGVRVCSQGCHGWGRNRGRCLKRKYDQGPPTRLVSFREGRRGGRGSLQESLTKISTKKKRIIEKKERWKTRFKKDGNQGKKGDLNTKNLSGVGGDPGIDLKGTWGKNQPLSKDKRFQPGTRNSPKTQRSKQNRNSNR